MTWKGGFRVSRPKQKSALIAQTIVILKEKNEEKKTNQILFFLQKVKSFFIRLYLKLEQLDLLVLW